MKITFVNRLAGILWGGGERFDLEVARVMRRSAHEVQFVVGRRWSRLDLPMTEVPTTYVRTPYLRWLMYWGHSKQSRLLQRLGSLARYLDLDIFERMAFRKIVSDRIYERTDIFQINGLPRLGAWLCEGLRARSVILWHGPPNPKVRHWNEKCSASLACGDSVAAVRNNVDPEVKQIFPGVDSGFFRRVAADEVRSRYHIPEDGIVFIFVGRLVPIKNLSFLLEAFALALRQNPLLYLMIVGDGPARSALLKKASALGLGEHVIFTGRQMEEALVRHYSAADVFVISSTYESFSIVVLEAMACELPIIATRVGELPDIVRDGHTGVLVESGDIEGLTSALLKMAEAPSCRRAMGRLGREEVVQKYSWLETARQMVTVYQSLVETDRL